MEDSAKSAIQFLTSNFAIDAVTRIMPGKLAGEWLCVNDNTKQAFVVLLHEQDALEADSYEEAVAKYGHDLEEV